MQIRNNHLEDFYMGWTTVRETDLRFVDHVRENKEALRRSLERDVRDAIARGVRVEEVPYGVSGECLRLVKTDGKCNRWLNLPAEQAAQFKDSTGTVRSSRRRHMSKPVNPRSFDMRDAVESPEVFVVEPDEPDGDDFEDDLPW